MFGSSGVTVLLADDLSVELEDATLEYACDDLMTKDMNILICDERECGPPLNWPWSAKQSLFVDYLLVHLKQTIRCAHHLLSILPMLPIRKQHFLCEILSGFLFLFLFSFPFRFVVLKCHNHIAN
jgi:hypothetical protein